MESKITRFDHSFFDPSFVGTATKKATEWDGSTVHIESAIAADNPSREENIRTIASRLARFNAMESERDALRDALESIADTAERASYVQDRSVGIIKQTCAMIASDAREAVAAAGGK